MYYYLDIRAVGPERDLGNYYNFFVLFDFCFLFLFPFGSMQADRGWRSFRGGGGGGNVEGDLWGKVLEIALEI